MKRAFSNPARAYQPSWARSLTVAALTVAMVIGASPSGMRSAMAQEALPDAKKLESKPTASQPSSDPIVVVTLGSINQLTQDLNYLSGALGQPQLGGMFAMMAGTFTQGIDTSKPVGVVVPIIDGVPEPMAMVPTRDVKKVLKRLEAQTGPIDELDDGTLVIAIGANTVFIRQVADWAVLARTRAVLDQSPADPAALISDMGDEYDVAVKLDVQQIPVAIRDGLVEQLRRGFEQAMEQQEPGEDVDSTREFSEQSLEQLEQVISQTDDLMIGIDIDSTERQLVFDVSFTAVPGSELATIYQSQKPIPSAFSMVIREDATAYFHSATSVGPEVIEQARSSIDGGLKAARQLFDKIDQWGEVERTEAALMLQRIADLVLDSYAEGKMDVGGLLLTDADEVQFVLGTFVADGDEAAKIVKDIAAKLEDRGDAPRFEFDIDTYKGVTMHLIEAEVPADEDEVRKIFGDTIRVHIGTAPNAVYVALGDSSQALLNQMIDKAETPSAVPANSQLLQMQVNLMPLLQFAQSIENNDAIASMLDALARASDAGQLFVTSLAVENGATTKVVLGDGLLQALGAAYREAQMAEQNDQF